jgi:hypothetical protein
MSDTPVNSLIADVLKFQYNPAAIQSAVIKKLDEAMNGTMTIVDPSNPFVFCLESAAVLTAAFMTKNQNSTRKQYPFSAQNVEDLYDHMSDKDYIDRFATPSKTKFSFIIPLEELLIRMVTDPSTGNKKITIPRNSYFTIANTNFSIQYPIEIRQLTHGGLQIVYDAEIESPLNVLETNFIDHEIRLGPEGEVLFFEIQAHQFDIITQTSTINAAVDFKLDINLNNYFYYARVYVQDVASKWVEIKTTHSEQIYDPAVPTAVIKVIDDVVRVSIPQIYTGEGALTGSVRIDIYQTKGPMELTLWEYPPTAFAATWLAIDKSEEDIYTAPLKTIRTMLLYSDKTVTGGSMPLEFEALRSRVIKNAIGSPTLPITNVQIESKLEREGYQIVKNIDNLTNRVFLATRNMPTPVDDNLITSAASSIETLQVTMETAIFNNSIIDNGESITITPDTLFKITDGIISIVSNEEMVYLNSLPVNVKAITITNGNYLYTPFHYVLDATGTEFSSRPYYLDRPVVETKLFVTENDTTLYQVGTRSYDVFKTATGYKLQVITQSSSNFIELDDSLIHVQLGYVPQYEKDKAFLNGTLVETLEDGERVYEFNLNTTFNIDSNNNLALDNFALYTPDVKKTFASLLTNFDIVYATSSAKANTWQVGKVDLGLGGFILPANTYGITQETLRVRFGNALPTLWARARSILSSLPYRTWEVDVPAVYEDDVFLLDASGSSITIDGSGNAVVNYLHRKNDPILDTDGTAIMRHQKGDLVLDSSGNPILIGQRSIIRQIDIVVIEAAYVFATDLSTINYRKTMTRTIVDWITNDLTKISDKLLEQTRLYFYPKTTLGTIEVMTGNGVVKTINAGQSFGVDLYLSGASYSNQALRERLTKTTIKVISEQIKLPTVSLDAISAALRAQYGNDVISVQVNGLGGSENITTLTVVDDANRCSIRKRLVALPDDTLIVEEDVNLNFIRHELK